MKEEGGNRTSWCAVPWKYSGSSWFEAAFVSLSSPWVLGFKELEIQYLLLPGTGIVPYIWCGTTFIKECYIMM